MAKLSKQELIAGGFSAAAQEWFGGAFNAKLSSEGYNLLGTVVTAIAASIPPVALAAPTISGDPKVGNTLTANRGDYTTKPTAFTQRWYADSVPIQAASGTTYTLTSAEYGKLITFAETPINNAGAGKLNTSDPIQVYGTGTLQTLTLAATTVPLNNQVVIAINGATAGSVITGTMPNGLVLNSDLRTISGIPNVAGTTTISLVETLDGAVGNPKTTNITFTVSSNIVTAPITVTDTVGEQLRIDSGTWSAGLTIQKYQWIRDGADVTGATSNTYQVTDNDVRADGNDCELYCQITVSDGAGVRLINSAKRYITKDQLFKTEDPLTVYPGRTITRTLWLDPVNGDDANDGLSEAKPKKDLYNMMFNVIKDNDCLMLLPGRAVIVKPDRIVRPFVLNGPSASDNNHVQVPARTCIIWARYRKAFEKDPLGDGKGFHPARFGRASIIDGIIQWGGGGEGVRYFHMTDIPQEGDTVNLAGVTYTFVNTVGSIPYSVKIVNVPTDTLSNNLKATATNLVNVAMGVNLGVPGVDYSADIVTNPMGILGFGMNTNPANPASPSAFFNMTIDTYSNTEANKYSVTASAPSRWYLYGILQFTSQAPCDLVMGYIARTGNQCYTGYPDTFAGQTWQDVGAGSDVVYNKGFDYGSGGLGKFYRCEHYTGYGRDQQKFDHTKKYREFNSPAYFSFNTSITGNPRKLYDSTSKGTGLPGWGDTDYSTYNTLTNGNSAISGTWRNLEIKESYTHDQATNYAVIETNIGGTVNIVRNWLARTCLDQIHVSTNATPFYKKIVVHGNIIQDSCGDGRDASNPHSDIFQLYTRMPGGSYSKPMLMHGIESNNNMAFYTPGARAQPQGMFWQMSSDHYVTQKSAGAGLKMRNNLLIGCQKAIVAMGRDFYIRNNMSLNPPSLKIPTTPTIQNPVLNSGADITRYGDNNLADAGNSRGIVADNIFELIANSADAALSNNLVTGLTGAGVPLDKFSVGLISDTAYPTAHAWFEAAKRLPEYATQGPQYNSVRDLIFQPQSFTGERPWVGFLSNTNVPPSTLSVSNLSFVHGGNDGDMLQMTESTGNFEWRVLEKNQITVYRDWSSAMGSVPVNKYIQLRATSSDTAAAAVVPSFKLGGVLFKWQVVTASNNNYPSVMFNNIRLTRSMRTPTGLQPATTFWMYARVRPNAANSGKGVTILGGGAGSTCAIQLNITSQNIWGFNFKGSLLQNVAGGVIATSKAFKRDSNTVVELLVSVDMTKSSFAEGVKSYQRIGGQSGVWDNNTPAIGVGWIQNAPIGLDYYNSNGAADLFVGGVVNAFSNEEIQAIAYGTDKIDVSDPATRALFEVDQVGRTFKGISGIQPLFAFIGQKTIADSATPTLGTFGGWTKSGTGTFDAVSDQTWPVPISSQLYIPIKSYKVGDVVPITFIPSGYYEAGATVTINVPGNDPIVTAVPEGTGGVTVNAIFKNSGSNPIAATVTSSYGYPNPLTRTVLVSAQ